MRRLLCITTLALVAAALPRGGAAEPDVDQATAGDDSTTAEDSSSEVIEIVETVEPGAAHVVDSETLERFEHDDIHKVLSAVPGVYIREEDGYGLRPNIGMRGTGSERSAKIALHEDGVLIAPAPYSAPAAYYFPLVTRMTGVEVLKGPAAIRFGPNTVGGALNMITRQIPHKRVVGLDVAGGSNLYGKAHAYYGEQTEHFGLLVEGVKLRTDGFKQLDGSGNTGFDKNDVMAKMRYQSSATARIHHQVQLKAAYSDEESDETYTGLSDSDFAASPYRRYAGTQLDHMSWDHTQVQLSHVLSWDTSFTLDTKVYRIDFARSWRKLNGFNLSDRDLREVLANPTAGNNAVYYALLTGTADSTTPDEALLIGTNARDFASQGIQTTLRAERTWLGMTHELAAGTRLHYDRARRVHTEDPYMMQGGDLVGGGGPTNITRDTFDSTIAWASYYNHKVKINDSWIVTAGLRGELIHTKHVDEQGSPTVVDNYFVMIPGGGVVYQIRPELGLLAGVHRGFVPVAPGQDNVDPEKSISYETGARVTTSRVVIEALGFFSNYQNLLGTCTFSTGCADGQVGQNFNGGRVHSYGAEVLVAGEPTWKRLSFPARVAYTFQRSVFQNSFASSNPQWGEVEVGDRLPYLPAHQVSVEAGVKSERLQVAVSGRYTTAMRDIAGQGEIMPDSGTDSALILGAAAHYKVPRWGELYLTVQNLLNEAFITSRRPYGARPGAPRLIVAGYKNSF